MKLWWVGTLVWVVSTLVQAQATWFTVAGNPLDPLADTVQVDPRAARSDSDVRTMSVRVSRAGPRKNWDGLPYRSYVSEVAFDCRAGRAEYRRASFYAQPLWQGPVLHEADYQKAPQPMTFRGMSPNPTQRLVRAACRSGAD